MSRTSWVLGAIHPLSQRYGVARGLVPWGRNEGESRGPGLDGRFRLKSLGQGFEEFVDVPVGELLDLSAVLVVKQHLDLLGHEPCLSAAPDCQIERRPVQLTRDPLAAAARAHPPDESAQVHNGRRWPGWGAKIERPSRRFARWLRPDWGKPRIPPPPPTAHLDGPGLDRRHVVSGSAVVLRRIWPLSRRPGRSSTQSTCTSNMAIW
jgi:hypothetical protein